MRQIHKMKEFTVFVLLICSTLGKLDTEWWKHTSIYEMIVFSFKDSDGDGMGDIKGITSKLDHFVDLGIESLYFTPVFKSPMIDMGYDVADYYQIDPRYGTMADFEELIKEMNIRGLKLILELVINHSSDFHEWFQKSINKVEPYTNYYVWKDPKGYDNVTGEPIAPNKWEGGFGGTVWKWVDKRKQFYLHNFMEQQPDLNLRSDLVKTALKDIIKFWLDKGVAGFRLDAPMYFVEDLELREGKQKDVPESLKFIHEMRTFFDEYNQQIDGFERFLSAETRVLPTVLLQYYGKKNYPILHFAFIYYLENILEEVTAPTFNVVMENLFLAKPEGAIAAWVAESHDGPRIGDRLRPEYADIFTTVLMMLPGVANLYYGQEIAMTSGYTRSDQRLDISGEGTRDPHRLPMNWDSSMNAGFSRKTGTCLPTSSNYYEKNVEAQKKQNYSHYHMFKTLSELRKTPTLKFGDYKSHVYSKWVYIFWRTYEPHQRYVVIINFKNGVSSVTLENPNLDSFNTLTIVSRSVNSEHRKGDRISRTEKFFMRPMSCIVLTTA